MHEDVDLTNYAQQPLAFRLELEIDADFADYTEAGGQRRQQGELRRNWRKSTGGVWELDFDYRAEHAYDHPTEAGVARLERGLTLQVKEADSSPSWEEGRLTFQVEIEPHSAKLHMSELLWWFDRQDDARALYRQAEELKKRFNERFWLEDEGFFALALDSDGRPIRSITSNPGHCIATAIAAEARVRPTADRMLGDELFSGWGVRTLSSKHPAYNPYSYHRGSVWPVEQGTFALGFYRFGLHEHVERICRAVFEAASLFDFYRLPELFSGHSRDANHPFPAMYPQANSPQAWSASTVFVLLQAMLGLYPYAPLNMLLVDPHLPEWLPEITLENLHVGDAVVMIRFRRKADGTSTYRILEKRGKLHVIRQPSPWSLTASFGERLKDSLVSLLPGK